MKRLDVLYVAGPMTGIPEYNYPAFDSAAAQLVSAGYACLNPARRGVVEGWEWSDYLRMALRDVTQATGVALLGGWETSRGALLEIHVANALDMRVEPLDVWLKGADRHGAAA